MTLEKKLTLGELAKELDEILNVSGNGSRFCKVYTVKDKLVIKYTSTLENPSRKKIEYRNYEQALWLYKNMKRIFRIG